MRFHGRFHTYLKLCYISKLHETSRREKKFISSPRTSGATFPTPQNEDETCAEELGRFMGAVGLHAGRDG